MTDPAPEMPPSRGEKLIGWVVVLSASLYRPIILWGRNAWDLSSPVKLLALGLVVFLIGVGLNRVFLAVGLKPTPASLGAAGVLLLLVHWNTIGPVDPIWWLAPGIVAMVASDRWLGHQTLRGLAYVAITVLGVAPLVQLVVAHVAKTEPYPIVELQPRVEVTADARVDDILLLVVDSYPGPVIAEDWLRHDPSPIAEELEDLGYTVWGDAFSQHTYTGLAVPGILELQPITTPDLARPCGNRLSTYRIIRGDSLVAASLRSAGYTYTHIESGWDAGACGQVDVCKRSIWLDEMAWTFLRPTIIGDWLERRYGTYLIPATLHVADTLTGLASLFADGKRDYIYAHLLLPHPPAVADSQCQPDIPETAAIDVLDMEDPGGGDTDRYDQQLTCVDGLLEDIAVLAGPTTAVLITGDHGTSTNGQVGMPPTSWSDADIAERLSVFLAYRLPEGCPAPSAPRTNIEAMRAIMTCATDIVPPVNNGMYLLEGLNPEWVDPGRMSSIQERLAAHQIEPESDG